LRRTDPIGRQRVLLRFVQDWCLGLLHRALDLCFDGHHHPSQGWFSGHLRHAQSDLGFDDHHHLHPSQD
jgi:hypothetical protein